uniref:hypothetical protein n=1 Tax=Enterobacter sp. IF2SW-P2 TaxID=1841144 RepID=UPI001C408403
TKIWVVGNSVTSTLRFQPAGLILTGLLPIDCRVFSLSKVAGKKERAIYLGLSVKLATALSFGQALAGKSSNSDVAW